MVQWGPMINSPAMIPFNTPWPSATPLLAALSAEAAPPPDAVVPARTFWEFLSRACETNSAGFLVLFVVLGIAAALLVGWVTECLCSLLKVVWVGDYPPDRCDCNGDDPDEPSGPADPRRESAPVFTGFTVVTTTPGPGAGQASHSVATATAAPPPDSPAEPPSQGAGPERWSPVRGSDADLRIVVRGMRSDLPLRYRVGRHTSGIAPEWGEWWVAAPNHLLKREQVARGKSRGPEAEVGAILALVMPDCPAEFGERDLSFAHVNGTLVATFGCEEHLLEVDLDKLRDDLGRTPGTSE